MTTRQYFLIDNDGNKVDVLPLVVSRPKLREFCFLFAGENALETWQSLTAAETKCLIMAILAGEKGNTFERQSLRQYSQYSRQRLTQLLSALVAKRVIKRVARGRYLISPDLALKGGTANLKAIRRAWDGDAHPQDKVLWVD